MFQGSWVALVTPFDDKGNVDFKKWDELIDFHLENGTDGLIPCGTTGETPTLTKEEKKKLITRTIQKAKGKIPVVAGTGSYSTTETIEMTKFAQNEGATGVLVVTPYYNKPTPEGLFRHFDAIAKETTIPIILYNVPGRTALNMPVSVVKRLSQISNVKAIKEASGSLVQVMEILQQTNLIVLSGDDPLTLPILAVGGKGVISVAANIIPKQNADMIRLYFEGKIEEARKEALRMLPLCQALFYETNPIPVKTALKLMGKVNGKFRLPLCEMESANEEKLKKAMKEYGLL